MLAGKTTVARILGKLLCSVGALSSNKVTEVQRSDLVGEFLGQTGPKTRKKVLGTLFEFFSFLFFFLMTLIDGYRLKRRWVVSCS